MGVALGLILAALVSGCTYAPGSSSTADGLRGAGFRNVDVTVQTGPGLPKDGAVEVSYTSGPTSDAAADAYTAAGIVWRTLDYRFGALAIVDPAGNCTGASCVDDTRVLGSETYAQLLAQFGRRPSGLDAKSAKAVLQVPTWTTPVLGVLLAGALVLVVVRRRRPSPARARRTPTQPAPLYRYPAVKQLRRGAASANPPPDDWPVF